MTGTTTPDNDTSANDTPATDPPPTLADLRAEAVQLVASLPASVRHIRVASGSAVVEVDW
ncbi:MAG: hypothetical protein H7Y15_05100, partial [Pseudonocardia sp.]|nr:hypothetical protein [Pseudonocardia sp.]